MRRAALLVALLASLAFVVACGDDPDVSAPYTGEAGVEGAADTVLQAMRDRAEDRIRGAIAGSLRDRLQQRDYERLAGCVPEGAAVDIVESAVKVNDGTASVDLTLRVTLGGTSTTVERLWEFERDGDDVWRLRALSGCPLE